MKKNMIALLLSIVMVVGSVGGSSVFAAETTEQEASKYVQEKEAEEMAMPEESEETDEAISAEDTAEEESAQAKEGLTEEAEPVQLEDEQEIKLNSEVMLESEEEEVTKELSIQNEDDGIIEVYESGQVVDGKDAVSDVATRGNVAQAIWTEGNDTLTFYYGPQYFEGDLFGDEVVTNVWSGAAVTDSGYTTPAWNDTVKNAVSHVIVDDGFAQVSPSSTYEWFKDCGFLTDVKINGLNTSGVVNMSYMFSGCSSLTSLDLSSLNTANVNDMSYMFCGCSFLENLNLSGLNTSNVVNMEFMFGGCSNLSSLDVSSFVTSKVSIMSYMFSACESLKSLDLSSFVTTNVIHMEYMFQICRSLESLDISSFDTSNVRYVASMFCQCESLKSLDLSGFETTNVANMEFMFKSCSSLTSLDLRSFDTSNVTSMMDMFGDCSSLKTIDLSSFNTSNVTDMNNMFGYCSDLASLDVSGFNTSNVTDMCGMFDGCSSLTSLDLSSFDTAKVTDMEYMFEGCSSLTSLDLSGFNTVDVTDMHGMFRDCSSLIDLDLSSFNVNSTAYVDNMFNSCYKLETIYCNDSSTEWEFDQALYYTMFQYCTSLVGRDGDAEIAFDEAKIGSSMAKSASLGGYFTPKRQGDDNYFVIGRDSNSFLNYYSFWGTTIVGEGRIGTAYPVSAYYLARLALGLSSSQIGDLINALYNKDGWQGACEGISISLGMAFLKKIDISIFNGDDGKTPECYNDLAAPINDNLSLRDLIHYYHLLQYVGKNNSTKNRIINIGDGIPILNGILTSSDLKEFWKTLITDVKEANSKKIPLLFSMGYREKGKLEGHTILTCGYRDNKDYYVVQFYDPNISSPSYYKFMQTPDIEPDYLYLFISKATYDFWFSTSEESVNLCNDYASNNNWHSFQYFGIDNWEKISSEVEPNKRGYSTSKFKLFDTKSADSYVYFTIPAGEPFKLQNNSGQYLEYNNNEFQGTLAIYDFEIIDDSLKYRFKFDNDKDYSVTNLVDSTCISVRTDDNFMSVSVEGVKRIDIKDGKTLVLEGDGGSISYHVRLLMNTKEGLIELSGDAQNNTVISHDNDKIIIESDKSSEIVASVYDIEGNAISSTIKGNDTVIINEDWTDKKNIEQCEFAFSNDHLIFSGKEQRPTVVINDNSHNLVEQRDYEVQYKNNINPGTATVTITGIGNYEGTITKTFIILPGKITRGDMFNLANNVKVTWKEVPGATYYKVYREGITDKKESQTEPVIVTERLVGWDKQPGLTNGHAYRYKIVASLTGKGDASGDSTLSYSKVMYRLKTVVIRSVKNTSPGKVTVKYDKTTSGDSYVLQYGERQDMVGAKTKVVLGANNTSYVIGGLKKGKTYYVSIRVRKKVNGIDYYTTFGVPKKVTITK